MMGRSRSRRRTVRVSSRSHWMIRKPFGGVATVQRKVGKVAIRGLILVLAVLITAAATLTASQALGTVAAMFAAVFVYDVFIRKGRGR